jgi:hypothetical protein
MKTENIVTEEFTNLMTKQTRKVIYKRRKDLEKKYNFSNVYESEGNYYTHGILGWFNIDLYIK